MGTITEIINPATTKLLHDLEHIDLALGDFASDYDVEGLRDACIRAINAKVADAGISVTRRAVFLDLDAAEDGVSAESIDWTHLLDDELFYELAAVYDRTARA